MDGLRFDFLVVVDCHDLCCWITVLLFFVAFRADCWDSLFWLVALFLLFCH